MTEDETWVKADIDPTTIAVIDTNITCAVWISRRADVTLALEMRDEFLRKWGIPDEIWDERVDNLIDYIWRKGETPAISAGEFEVMKTSYSPVILGSKETGTLLRFSKKKNA